MAKNKATDQLTRKQFAALAAKYAKGAPYELLTFHLDGKPVPLTGVSIIRGVLRLETTVPDTDPPEKTT